MDLHWDRASVHGGKPLTRRAPQNLVRFLEPMLVARCSAALGLLVVVLVVSATEELSPIPPSDREALPPSDP